MQKAFCRCFSKNLHGLRASTSICRTCSLSTPWHTQLHYANMCRLLQCEVLGMQQALSKVCHQSSTLVKLLLCCILTARGRSNFSWRTALLQHRRSTNRRAGAAAQHIAFPESLCSHLLSGYHRIWLETWLYIKGSVCTKWMAELVLTCVGICCWPTACLLR
jgi:hypothetical protein